MNRPRHMKNSRTVLARPSEVPSANGSVRTRDLATVMDTGNGPPELCLGPVAESYPPQCGGPELVGWDWSATRGVSEREGKVRWGLFMVTGTWGRHPAHRRGQRAGGAPRPGGACHRADAAAPAAVYTDEELAAVQEDVQDLPGAQGAYVQVGHVHVDVTYDDQSVQAYADRTYGEDVVLVRSQLVPVG